MNRIEGQNPIPQREWEQLAVAGGEAGEAEPPKGRSGCAALGARVDFPVAAGPRMTGMG